MSSFPPQSPLIGLQTTPTAGMLSEARASKLLSTWKLTPATLYSKLHSDWIPAKWLQYLSFEIASAVARGNCGLLISAPPRHGKSMLITQATPIWALENFPQKNVVVATYGEELSSDFSRQVRDDILGNQDILTVRLRNDTQRVTNFLTTQGGGLKAVGLGGAITGRGAHIFILDDYIKQAKEAMSATYLEDLWTWYRTVARTRLEPGAVVIIVATRWVTNDLHGRIETHQKTTGSNFFKIIKLPALSMGESVDLLGRPKDETLFPERYTKDDILEIKRDVGTRWFGAMFQQDPQGDENAAVNPEWFKTISRPNFESVLERLRKNPSQMKWVRSWDLASTKEAGDFTAGARCLYDKTSGDFFIEDMIRGQYSSAKVEALFKSAVESDELACPGIEIGIEQEPGSSGAYTIRHFESIAKTQVPNKKVTEHKATNAKLLNSQPLLAAAEAGNVYYVEGPWNGDFIEELSLYPEGANDDQMDAVSNAYKQATGKKPMAGAFGRSEAAVNAGKTGSEKVNIPPKYATPQRKRLTFGR